MAVVMKQIVFGQCDICPAEIEVATPFYMNNYQKLAREEIAKRGWITISHDEIQSKYPKLISGWFPFANADICPECIKKKEKR